MSDFHPLLTFHLSTDHPSLALSCGGGGETMEIEQLLTLARQLVGQVNFCVAATQGERNFPLT